MKASAANWRLRALSSATLWSEIALATVGASLVFVTVMVKDWVSTLPAASVAVRIIEWSPTSLLVGVPESTPVVVLKLNHEGRVGAA